MPIQAIAASLDGLLCWAWTFPIPVKPTQQRENFLDDDSYLLEVPYADDRELMHDILRQGHEVEVLSPMSLRDKVTDELRAMMAVYDPKLGSQL